MADKVILCVDDEAVILQSLKEQLKRRFADQYVYEMAGGPEEAWEILEELQANQLEVLIIVSDWLMPGMKGDEFLTQVHRKYPQIVTVLLTGQADEAEIARAHQDANLHRCLYKPWTEEDLTNTIISGLE